MEDDPLHESRAVAMTMGAALSRAAETTMRTMQEQRRQEQFRSQQAAEEMRERLAAQARTAEGQFRAAVDPSWVSKTKAAEHVDTLKAMQVWRDVDPQRFGTYAEQMENRLAAHYSSDVVADIRSLVAVGDRDRAVSVLEDAAEEVRDRADDERSEGRDDQARAAAEEVAGSRGGNPLEAGRLTPEQVATREGAGSVAAVHRLGDLDVPVEVSRPALFNEVEQRWYAEMNDGLAPLDELRHPTEDALGYRPEWGREDGTVDYAAFEQAVKDAHPSREANDAQAEAESHGRQSRSLDDVALNLDDQGSKAAAWDTTDRRSRDNAQMKQAGVPNAAREAKMTADHGQGVDPRHAAATAGRHKMPTARRSNNGRTPQQQRSNGRGR